METKFGFTKMTVDEFTAWINSTRIARTILKVQQHHTYLPDYRHFDGNNHFERQKAMKTHHMVNNGWSDIGQHFTIFPDGTILTGRNLENTPACTYGQNANSICIENFGNFDSGADVMTTDQKEAIISVTAILCKKFNLPVNTHSVIYHHWFDLSTGQRNNTTRNKKTCPGSNFFEGNKESDCENNFLPLVQAYITGEPVSTPAHVVEVMNYVFVTADMLNIRIGPSASSAKAADREAVTFGTVLRVYEEQNGWLKISGSQSHWVSGRFAQSVQRAIVTANTLNIRRGPGTHFDKAGSFTKDEVVFIFEEKDGWACISPNDLWVFKRYLN